MLPKWVPANSLRHCDLAVDTDALWGDCLGTSEFPASQQPQRKGWKKSDAALASNVGLGLICGSGRSETSVKPTDMTTSKLCVLWEFPG